MKKFRELLTEGEKSFLFKDKTIAVKSLSKASNRGKVFNFNDDGSWDISDKALPEFKNSMNVNDLQGYWGGRYTVTISVQHSLTDLEYGKFDPKEVELRYESEMKTFKELFLESTVYSIIIKKELSGKLSDDFYDNVGGAGYDEYEDDSGKYVYDCEDEKTFNKIRTSC